VRAAITATRRSRDVHISGRRQSQGVWAEPTAHAGRHPISTMFSFELNLPARLTLTFTRVQRGRVAGRSLRRTGHAGLKHVHFTGRMGNGRWLPAGRYELVITARGAAGHTSTSRPLRFTILRVPTPADGDDAPLVWDGRRGCADGGRNRGHNVPLERSGRDCGPLATWGVINIPR
jgi:hypothetical protein